MNIVIGNKRKSINGKDSTATARALRRTGPGFQKSVGDQPGYADRKSVSKCESQSYAMVFYSAKRIENDEIMLFVISVIRSKNTSEHDGGVPFS